MLSRLVSELDAPVEPTLIRKGPFHDVPEILIGHIAENTEHIRVGSGGVMLSHYSPLKVAENFRVLEAVNGDNLDAMEETNTMPEMECFDVGIVRSVGLYLGAGMAKEMHYNFVMGVASGMPCDPELLPFLLKYKYGDAHWQATLIGRSEIWEPHQKAADLGGMLRTGVEDTFYLPNGDKTTGNGPLIEALSKCALNAGREVATPEEARAMLGFN